MNFAVFDQSRNPNRIDRRRMKSRHLVNLDDGFLDNRPTSRNSIRIGMLCILDSLNAIKGNPPAAIAIYGFHEKARMPLAKIQEGAFVRPPPQR